MKTINQLKPNRSEQLYQKIKAKLRVENGEGRVQITIAPSESFIYELKK